MEYSIDELENSYFETILQTNHFDEYSYKIVQEYLDEKNKEKDDQFKKKPKLLESNLETNYPDFGFGEKLCGIQNKTFPERWEQKYIYKIRLYIFSDSKLRKLKILKRKIQLFNAIQFSSSLKKRVFIISKS